MSIYNMLSQKNTIFVLVEKNALSGLCQCFRINEFIVLPFLSFKLHTLAPFH